MNPYIELLQNTVIRYEDEIKRLREENERLKEELKEYKRTNDYYEAWGRDSSWG